MSDINITSLIQNKNTDFSIIKDDSGKNLLLSACFQDNFTLVDFILNSKSIDIDIDTIDNDGNTALHYAISNKNLEMTELLLFFSANPNISNNALQTPLILSTKNKSLEITKLILSYTDIDVNKQDINGFTAYMYSCLNGWSSICINLLENFYDLTLYNSHDGMDGFMYTINMFPDNKESLKGTLINYIKDNNIPFNYNHYDHNNISTLMIIIEYQDDDLINHALPYFNFNKINEQRKDTLENLLFCAVYTDNIDLIDILIANGADLYALDNKNRNLLLYGFHYKCFTACKHLLNYYNFDNTTFFNHQDSFGLTALMHAIIKKCSDLDLINFLINSSNIYLEDKKGFTALSYAIKSEFDEYVKLLIAKYIKDSMPFDLTSIVLSIEFNIKDIYSLYFNIQ